MLNWSFHLLNNYVLKGNFVVSASFYLLAFNLLLQTFFNIAFGEKASIKAGGHK